MKKIILAIIAGIRKLNADHKAFVEGVKTGTVKYDVLPSNSVI